MKFKLATTLMIFFLLVDFPLASAGPIEHSALEFRFLRCNDEQRKFWESRIRQVQTAIIQVNNDAIFDLTQIYSPGVNEWFIHGSYINGEWVADNSNILKAQAGLKTAKGLHAAMSQKLHGAQFVTEDHPGNLADNSILDEPKAWIECTHSDEVERVKPSVRIHNRNVIAVLSGVEISSYKTDVSTYNQERAYGRPNGYLPAEPTLSLDSWKTVPLNTDRLLITAFMQMPALVGRLAFPQTPPKLKLSEIMAHPEHADFYGCLFFVARLDPRHFIGSAKPDVLKLKPLQSVGGPGKVSKVLGS